SPTASWSTPTPASASTTPASAAPAPRSRSGPAPTPPTSSGSCHEATAPRLTRATRSPSWPATPNRNRIGRGRAGSIRRGRPPTGSEYVRPHKDDEAARTAERLCQILLIVITNEVRQAFHRARRGEELRVVAKGRVA